MNAAILVCIGFFIGCIVVSLIPIRRTPKRASRISQNRARRNVMESAVEHRLSQGPVIAAIGGGTGLSTLLSGLKGFTRNITAVVTVTDEGGSSGRLRQEWGVLPPGDVRNCLVALAENDNSLNRILNFRFDRGELAGHNLGNLMLLAVSELVGDFRSAVEELNHLLAIRGRVLPVTTETVILRGETVDGLSVRGELEISEHGKDLARIWLEPKYAKPLEEVISAILDAEFIVMGPGSLFTSILPNLLIEEVAEAVRNSNKPKAYVANLMTQPKETEGMNITAHLDWIVSVLGEMPDYVIVNQTPIPTEYLNYYREKGAEPLYLSKEEECFIESRHAKVVYADLVALRDGRYLRHNARNLAEILIKLAREDRD